MNKILIVGHPQSGYSEVERLLRACGMASAQPSRREGFAPEQISDTLCRAHRAAPLHTLGQDREVEQIDVAPVWQGLAMDLMLGNIDQPLWGWADPKAVHLLDYWRSLDPSLHFILVYDRPHSMLTRGGLEEAATLTRETLRQRLDAWSAYNAALLAFHLRNPERSLLVHSEQVRQSAEDYLQQVRARIDAPWKDRIVGVGVSTALLSSTEVEDARPGAQPRLLVGDIALGSDALSTFVAGSLLKDQLGSLALYEEMQASASLPLEIELAQGEDPALGMEAWLSMVAQQETLQNQHKLARQLQASRDQAEQLAHDRERLIDEERQLRAAEQQDMTRQLTALQQERAQVEAAQADVQQENERLLSQLHQVQEEVERNYLNGQQQTQRIATLQQQEQLANARGSELDALNKQLKESAANAEQRAAQLATLQQQAAVAETQLKKQTTAQADTQQENELLLSQLHQVQEEVERNHLNGQQQTQRIATLQQQEQLANARGSELDALNKQLKESAANAEQRAAQLAALQQQAAVAATQLKKQTEHRIGALTAEMETLKAKPQPPTIDPALAEENELLLSQLHQVQEELERYYLENQRMKAGAAPAAALAHAQPQQPALYGAAARVKQHLSYRLGAQMIAHSHNLRGWFGMPWALMSEVQQFRAAQRRPGAKTQPPLHTYRDAHEAERVKKHLSYRLGERFIAHSRSPIGWLRLPFALRNEVKQFRQQNPR